MSGRGQRGADVEDRAAAAAAELRETIREAHEARKDLLAAMAECQKMQADITNDVATSIRDAFKPLIEKQIKANEDALAERADKQIRNVKASLDTLTAAAHRVNEQLQRLGAPADAEDLLERLINGALDRMTPNLDAAIREIIEENNQLSRRRGRR